MKFVEKEYFNDNKTDWDEINECEYKRKKEELNRYGLNISNINIQKETKTANKVVTTLKTFNFISIFILAFAIFVVISMLMVNYENFIFATLDSKAKIAMKEKYNLNVTIWRKVKFEKENYFMLEMSSNENENITFTAIRKNNNINDDYIQQKHKYYFDLWDSNNKTDFKINEYISNNLLSYEIYIDTFDEIEDATRKIIEFRHFCDKNFISEWELYIKIKNKKIYPYKNVNLTDEQIIEYTKKQYNKII